MQQGNKVGLLVHVSNAFAIKLQCERNLTAGNATLLRLLKNMNLNLAFELSYLSTLSYFVCRVLVLLCSYNILKIKE